MATNTYTKLRDGRWGVRATVAVQPGSVISVETKAGKVKQETVTAVLWSGRDNKTGQTIHLCAVQSSGSGPVSNGNGNGSSGRKRGTRTGCSCGSVEEYERPSDCASCRYDRD